MNMSEAIEREKKIAEIREALERAKGKYTVGTITDNRCRFLLSELESLEREYAEERAAHNAHVAELCELEQERNMYKSSSEVFYERLKKEAEQREKLVECLRFYERMARGREINDGGRRARTLLAEIGAAVMQHEPR